LSIYFIDTSALGKRYLQEVGSTWLRNLIDPKQGHTFIISELALVEVVSAIEKNRRKKMISLSDANSLGTLFFRHARNEYLQIPLETKILNSASQLLIKHRTHALRSLDAIQLATALIITQPIIFIASDKNLRAAAASEKFPVDDPNLHP
jgi:uncharacterized protein